MDLKVVTITGADDQTCIGDMLRINNDFPFVEWGILLSKSSEGRPRFPSSLWIERLVTSGVSNISGHLCGKWVRDLLKGEGGFWLDRPYIAKHFKRIQLNFHAYVHKVKHWYPAFNFMSKLSDVNFLFQLDGVNDGLCEEAKKVGVNAFPFFDTSGGAGILPQEWPEITGYHGLAGGLSPRNLLAQLDKMEKVVNSPFWIDVETKVRTDEELNMMLVREFLTIAALKR